MLYLTDFYYEYAYSRNSLREHFIFFSKASFHKEIGCYSECADSRNRESTRGAIGARGIRLTLFEGQAQFVTSPQHTEVVKDFLKEDISGELTRAALETLAVIAYRGPVTKIEIEHVRGVNCSQSLRNLLIRGLIDSTEAAGEKKYILTFDFINHIGIQNIKDLPDYDALRDHARIQELLATDGKIESDAVSPNETV
jgi:chromosome segregation and condensation protein ScpB